MKRTRRFGLAIAVALLATGSTFAASIGVQFSGSGSSLMNTILNPDESAGVVPQTNWNVIKTVGGEAEAAIVNDVTGQLRDSAGNLTAVKLQYTGADDSWQISNAAAMASNVKLLSGEIKTHASMTFTWTGLSGGSYEVYLYGAVDGGEATMSVEAAGTTYYWTEPSSNDQPFAEAARSADPGAPGRGNYLHFTGLAPAAGETISITVTYLSGNGAEAAIGITGLQLVSTGAFPAGTPPPTHSSSLAVEFSGGNRGSAAVLAPDEAAGYVAQSNWNVVTTVAGEASAGTATFLKDSAGSTTAVALQYIGNDSWSTRAGRFDPDDRLMKGYLGQDFDGSMTLTFTNLAAGPYDLYLYGNVIDGPGTVSVSVGGATYYWTHPAAFNGFFKEAPGSTDVGNPGIGSVLRLSNVTPANGAITATLTLLDGSGVGISAIQLGSSIAFPGPNVSILPEPTSQVALAGGAATIASGAVGTQPITYQWQKDPGTGWANLVNDSRISGATSGSLTISNVFAADAISYRLIATDATARSATSSVVTLTIVGAAIGVDFGGDADNAGQLANWTLAPTDAAGVIPQQNWNRVDNRGGGGNPQALVGTSSFLADNHGNVTTVRLAYKANDAWRLNPAATTPDEKLMKGVLKNDSSEPMILTFMDLKPDSYDVLLYGACGDSPAVLSVSVGLDTYYWAEPQNFGGTYIQAPFSTDPENPSEGNYMHFSGLSPDANGAIEFTLSWVSGGAPFSLFGISAIQISGNEGAFTASGVAIESEPMPSLLYADGIGRFSISATTGFPPLIYQWQANVNGSWVDLVDSARISGATTPSLEIANVRAVDALSYRVLVRDSSGNSATSSTAALTIATPPAAGSYPAAVLSANPLAYYRLNETVGTSLFDYVGGNNGYYEPNALVGQPGLPNPPFVGIESGNTAFQSDNALQRTSFAHAPFGSLAGLNNVTFTAWVYPYSASGAAGLIVDRSGAGGGGGLMLTPEQELRYQWNTNTTGGIEIRTFDTELAVPPDQWSFVALVISPNGADLYVYNENGLASTNDPVALAPQTFGNDWHLGNEATDANSNQTFTGLIDEVAIFGSALSASEINALYQAVTTGQAPPRISLTRSGQDVTLIWSQGVLLQSPTVTGPWETNNSASSPLTIPATGSQQFFKLLTNP